VRTLISGITQDTTLPSHPSNKNHITQNYCCEGCHPGIRRAPHQSLMLLTAHRDLEVIIRRPCA
jgi:hypothetical protein